MDDIKIPHTMMPRIGRTTLAMGITAIMLGIPTIIGALIYILLAELIMALIYIFLL